MTQIDVDLQVRTNAVKKKTPIPKEFSLKEDQTLPRQRAREVHFLKTELMGKASGVKGPGAFQDGREQVLIETNGHFCRSTTT